MGKKITILAITFAILAFIQPAAAQKAGTVFKIGFLTAVSPGKTFKLRLAAFRQGLRKLGYVEGEKYRHRGTIREG